MSEGLEERHHRAKIPVSEKFIDFAGLEERHDDYVPVSVTLEQQIEAFKKEYPDVINAWAGYYHDKPSHIVLVVYTSKRDSEVPTTWNGYEVYCRVENEVSDEAKKVADEIVSKNIFQTSEELKRIRMEKAGILFKEHSNITMISSSPIKSKRGGERLLKQECIVIYCRVKGIIPCGEKQFPLTIDNFEVDIREGFFSLGMLNSDLPKSQDYQTNVRLGAEIRVEGSGKSGTVGGFLDLPNGEVGFLTCAHLAVKEETLHDNLNLSDCQIPVYQPDHISASKPNIVGELQSVVFDCKEDRSEISVDAAMIKLSRRLPVDGYMVSDSEPKLRSAGYSESKPPCFSSGKIKVNPIPGKVIKCGATTGITTGHLECDGICVRLEKSKLAIGQKNFTLFNQYNVLSILHHINDGNNNSDKFFFDLGDSGSLVMVEENGELFAVGMGIGKTTYHSCVVTPIRAILDKFELKTLKPFDSRIRHTSKKRKYDNDNGGRDVLQLTAGLSTHGSNGHDSKRNPEPASGVRQKTTYRQNQNVGNESDSLGFSNLSIHDTAMDSRNANTSSGARHKTTNRQYKNKIFGSPGDIQVDEGNSANISDYPPDQTTPDEQTSSDFKTKVQAVMLNFMLKMSKSDTNTNYDITTNTGHRIQVKNPQTKIKVTDEGLEVIPVSRNGESQPSSDEEL